MNPNPGFNLGDNPNDNRDLIPNCIGPNCSPPPKNKTTFEIDCSGKDCLIPFPTPPPMPIPKNNTKNETGKCKPGEDCPCTPGIHAFYFIFFNLLFKSVFVLFHLIQVMFVNF